MELPEVGFLRLTQVIGQPAVSEREAERNRKLAAAARKAGKRISQRPRRARPAIVGVIPLKKSAFLEGVKEGRFPKPIRLGPKAVAWRVEDIRALIERLGAEK